MAQIVPNQVKLELKKSAQRAKEGLPHLSALAEHFVSIAGGPRSMAKMLYTEWAAAMPGSIVRSRILELISRVWKFSSESLQTQTDLGILTDEDIDTLLEQRIQKAAEVLNAESSAGTPGAEETVQKESSFQSDLYPAAPSASSADAGGSGGVAGPYDAGPSLPPF